MEKTVKLVYYLFGTISMYVSSEVVLNVYCREKNKAEIKDKKVLEILQIKDLKIEELQTALTAQSREINEILAR